MGEAKRRGTFEQRKEQAIAAGRIKREKDISQKIGSGCRTRNGPWYDGSYGDGRTGTI